MESALFYIAPFVKNLAVLIITPFIVLLITALRRTGFNGFSFKLWLKESEQRFIVGIVLVASFSALAALTDIAPLFKFIGFDINSSPFGLGLGIAAILSLGINTKQRATKKTEKAKEIQKKAVEIIEKSADIVKDEEKVIA